MNCTSLKRVNKINLNKSNTTNNFKNYNLNKRKSKSYYSITEVIHKYYFWDNKRKDNCSSLSYLNILKYYIIRFLYFILKYRYYLYYLIL